MPGLRVLLGLLLVLALHLPARAQDRREMVNRSGQPWVLQLVEGTRASQGTLTLMDKFSGKPRGALGQVGDAAPLGAQDRFMAVFNREGGIFFLDFILKDPAGFYAEYTATVEYPSSRLSFALKDWHVGPPMDTWDEREVRQWLEDAIEIGSENILIRRKTIGGTPTLAKTLPETIETLHARLPAS